MHETGFGVRSQFCLRQNFHGHNSGHDGVLCFEHHTHSALADDFQNAILSQMQFRLAGEQLPGLIAR